MLHLRRPGFSYRERAVFVAGLLLVVCCTAGCTTYSTKVMNLRPELAAGDFESALDTVQQQTGKKDRMLFYLERGIILHYADRWRESNVAFAQAEQLAEDLYTKSLSEGALSLISNDGAISYRARPFELAMVPYYKAMNYIYLRDREAAQVEARRASLQMSRYVDVTLEGVRQEDRSELETTRNNAFLLLFSGLLYDWDGELNDAFIAYRNAAHAFQQSHDLLGTEIPPSLEADLLRTGRRLGFSAELDQLRESAPDVFTDRSDTTAGLRTREDYEQAAAWRAGHGRVALFLESGFVSHKTQIRFDFPVLEGEAYNDSDYWAWEIYGGMGTSYAVFEGYSIEYWVSVAAPEMQDSRGSVGRARVRAVPADSATAAVSGILAASPSRRVENLSRQARITFDAEKPTIFYKTILRGLTKYLASRGADKAGGEIAKWVANVFGAVTESADTRSWFTLPADIHLTTVDLPAGAWDLEVQVTGPHGEDLGLQVIEGVEVRAGDWTFLSRRLF